MTTREGTCAERLPAHLESRIEDFRSMIAWREAWSRADGRTAETRAEAAERRIQEYPADISVTYSVRVELSGGGPADYMIAQVSADGDVTSIDYHFLDWYDGAVVTLGGSDFDAAEEFIRASIDVDSISAYVR